LGSQLTVTRGIREKEQKSDTVANDNHLRFYGFESDERGESGGSDSH